VSARNAVGTLFIAVTALVVVGLAPTRAARSAAEPPPAVAVATADTATASDSALAERVKDGRTLLDEHFGPAADTARRYGTALCTYVVLVPDPIDSRLDWQFDAGLEAVKRAFESSRFVLERFWLPWVLDADSALRKRDRHTEPSMLRRTHPGVLLFRPADVRTRADSAPAVALVYLVPETPTTGTQAAVLAATLRERDALTARYARCAGDPPKGAELRVVGPTFSGSIESLRRVVAAWIAADRTRHVTVISGGATASQNRALMVRGDAAHIDYAATINPVGLLLGTTCRLVLQGALHVQPGEVALLTEGSTTFGRTVADLPSESGESGETGATGGARRARAPAALPLDTTCAHSLVIPFPMSVSRLRAEYARHPEATAANAPPPARGASRVPLDLEDPASAFENPPALSELTAPAVERVMDDIAQTLLTHRTRVVIVASTDVRDRIFVAGEIRRRLHDLRLVIVGSHALLLRPELNDELRGAMVVSTYPLFTENQFWTVQRPDAHDRVVFTNELAEGAYNATLFQLAPYLGYDTARAPGSDVGCGGPDGLELTDYRPPRAHGIVVRGGDTIYPSAARRPPVWLTVIGRTTVAPVQMYPVSDAGLVATLHSRLKLGCALDSGQVSEHAATRTTTWEYLALYLVAAAGALLALVAAGGVAGRRETPLETPPAPAPAPAAPSEPLGTRLSRFARRVRDPEPPSRAELTRDAMESQRLNGIARPLVVACAVAPLVLLPMRATAHAWPLSPWLVAGIVLAVGGVVAAACAMVVRVAVWHPAPESDAGALRRHGLTLVATLAYVALTVWYLGRVATLDLPSADAFYTRALQLASGVSPITPLLLGGALVVVWISLRYQRAKLLCTNFAYEADDDRHSTVVRVRVALARTVTAPGARFAAFPMVLLVSWMFSRLGRSVEVVALRDSLAFDALHRALLGVLLCLTVGSVYRLLAVWFALQVELRDVARQPHVAAFERLPEALATLCRVTPIERIPAREARNLIEDEIARRVNRLLANPKVRWPGLSRAERPASRLGGELREEDRLSGRKNARPTEGEAAVRTLRDFLRVHGGEGEHVRPVEELAALFTVDYIGWVVRHLRLLALQTLAALALTTMFLSSYPFEPQSLVRLVFFAIAVVGVAGLVVLLVQSNRDPVLSRIANTDPGELTWDAPFVINLLAVSAVPIVTILGTAFPEVRDVLFGWLAPILKTVGHG